MTQGKDITLVTAEKVFQGLVVGFLLSLKKVCADTYKYQLHRAVGRYVSAQTSQYSWQKYLKQIIMFSIEVSVVFFLKHVFIDSENVQTFVNL